MDIKCVISINKSIIEERLNEILNINLDYSQVIVDSMRYSLLAGGKRIRPTLFIETLKMHKVDYEKYLDIAAAIEMIHTYSLIHDDLPAMDNDSLRRGKPTNHVKFGENIAILAGDSLLNLAYELLFEFLAKYPSQNNIKACQTIAQCAGIYGMIGGQVSDVVNENKEISKENLKYIHMNKTAKLIIASIVSASYIAAVTDEELNIMKNYATNLGLAFQISDDILDIVGNSEDLGKTIGKDQKTGKNTYPKYFGLESSREKLQELTESSIDELSKLDKNTKFFEQLAYFIKNRKY